MTANPNSVSLECDRDIPSQCGSICCRSSIPDVELYNCATFDCTSRDQVQISRDWNRPCNTAAECQATCCRPPTRTIIPCPDYNCAAVNLIARTGANALSCNTLVAGQCSTTCCVARTAPTQLCRNFNCAAMAGYTRNNTAVAVCFPYSRPESWSSFTGVHLFRSAKVLHKSRNGRTAAWY
jgi:hypothetical protein